jgi:hypothetical protein
MRALASSLWAMRCEVGAKAPLRCEVSKQWLVVGGWWLGGELRVWPLTAY